MLGTYTSGSDDDMEWEEVIQDGIVIEIPEPSIAGPSFSGIKKGKGPGRKMDEAEKARVNAERIARINSHKLHTVALLANATTRNQWLNDPLLQARLMSITPLSHQNHFDMITKKNQPNQALRGRQFETAVKNLSDWWHDEFEVDSSLDVNVRSRTFAEVQLELREKGLLEGIPIQDGPTNVDMKGKGKAKQPDHIPDTLGEVIRSSKSLMKHALKMQGSRDTSAQLFTALCRALGVPARLVVSLQSVPWKSTVGKTASSKPKRPPDMPQAPVSLPATENDVHYSDTDDDMEEVVPPATRSAVDTKGKGKAVTPGSASLTKTSESGKSKGISSAAARQAVHLRHRRAAGRRASQHKSVLDIPPDERVPVFWSEVFSRPDGRWIPVDPTRKDMVNRRKRFEPSPGDRTNRMLYVVALEEDGFGRDVTPRYANVFGAKTTKLRLASARGKSDWWESVLVLIARPYRLHRDDIEDSELLSAQMTEAMPNSMVGFKAHPLYVLERHLRRDQVVHPQIIIGRFRGEPVYPRGNVIDLKTAENWMRSEGREIKEGEQPLKLVKIRAVTTARKREVELAQQAAQDTGAMGSAGDGVQQGLYAQWQTQRYVPPPVVDGRIPKNEFGNIDLYTPSMLPDGASHLPYKGIAKVARKLGIDFAEAVVGFEFKQRRALPILDGIVVAIGFEETLLAAYWETAQAAEEKERQQKEERVFKRWRKLIKGLRLRDRLLKEYAAKPVVGEKLPEVTVNVPQLDEGGGFLLNRTDVDVVHRFHLPKMQHVVVGKAKVGNVGLREDLYEADDQAEERVANNSEPWRLENEEDEEDNEDSIFTRPSHQTAVKSMADLALEAETEGDSEASTQGPRPRALIREPSLRSRVLRSSKSQDPPKRRVPARRAAVSFRSKGSASSPATSDVRSPRKRPRRQKSFATSGEDGDDSDDTQLTESGEDTEETPSKRIRKAESSPAPSTGRTLRARKVKTTEELREEKDREKAFRRAIAD